MNLRIGCCLIICLAGVARADTVEVRDAAGLKRALREVAEGTTLKLAPGEYGGGYETKNVADLTIEAADSENPPNFKGDKYAWHFSNCSGLTLRHLRVSGQSLNGLNLDDGGRADRPMRRVNLEHLHISDVGPKGNTDGLKCSGLDSLTIKGCTVEGWGGQAIDLVGCHQVEISDCTFQGKSGFSQASGVQCKGGSEDVTIESSRFTDAGQRPINAGGSTGLAYFRPSGAKFEARRVVIRKNVISGSLCACAFVGVDGAEFTGNTILFPEKWVFRLLQENTEEGFVASRNVKIEDNAILFRRRQVGVEVNVGPKTVPETMQFAGNRWFAEDQPDRSRPNLPTKETKGSYDTDPRLK